MKELTDVQRVVSRMEGQQVVVRIRREGRGIQGRCIAVSVRPSALKYLLIEVNEHAGVQERKPRLDLKDR